MICERYGLDFFVEAFRVVCEAHESKLDGDILFDAPVKLVHIVCTVLGPIFYTDYTKRGSKRIHVQLLHFQTIKSPRLHKRDFTLIFDRLFDLAPTEFEALLFLSHLAHDIIHVDIGFLVSRRKLNRLEATKLGQPIVIFQHQHN